MGVKDLWQILDPVKQHVHLHSLRGKTIAVDLSLWVCEAQTVKKMIGTVVKPHLRNLFFRISCLTLMDVQLVFVMEGEAPKLKADVIRKRNEVRYGPSHKAQPQKTGRSRFTSVLRECLDMLEILGIPWVRAAGEAEAMCAYLNASGRVDACLTNDGDAFLYGAQTVYRNFTMNTKDPHVDCYTMSSIKQKLGLDRDALVGLAVLLGCDYLPKGVPGVGKEQVLKLTQILKGQSLLKRFDQWNEKSCDSNPQPPVIKKLAHCSICSHPGSPKDHERNGCTLCQSDRYCEPHDYEYCCPCEWHQTEHARQLHAVEYSIRKKACSCEGFPFHEVIQEFLLDKNELVKEIKHQRPDLLLFQRFTLDKMEWPNPYACEKLLVLLTHYDMTERKLGRRVSYQLQPIRIVKTRIRNGIHCFEIEWEKPEHYAVEDEHGELLLQTVEEQALFEAAYPETVASYQKQKLEAQGKKQKSMKIQPKEKNFPVSDSMNFPSRSILKPTCEITYKQNSKLNLDMSSDSPLPLKSVSMSLNNLLLPRDTPCLKPQEQLKSSLQPVNMQQVNDASKPLISESDQPNTTSCNPPEIHDLHLSTIDWEGTSFCNSPAISRNSLSHGCKSEPEIAIPKSLKKIPEQSSCELQSNSRNDHGMLPWGIQKAKPDKRLLSDMTSLHLQDLPLKERIHMKSAYPRGYAQPGVDPKTLPSQNTKEPCCASQSPDYPPHLSKAPFSIYTPVVNRSGVKVEPPNAALDRSRKPNMQATQKIITKKSVCLDRHSSDEESVPVFGKQKPTTHRAKQSSQKHSLSQSSKDEGSTLSKPKTRIKENAQCVQAYRIAGNEGSYSPYGAKGSPSFLPHLEGKDDSASTCLDSPLPLCQRLKLRFQNT
ncbi:flap endonuclease GEN homolog 1 [Erinaceus europaeus]|uniref:Flap endonuclease GEN homolog 1 n=1 Tax=Erinaceus europaeus TaxID=9365 RepID=A0ABM3X6F0_ERIEU|nr:flap endonuclease GEN homolog 1 [Erinaceus europaeus]